ncbi:MAG: DNA primase [Coriobacteriaceae bacterium]|nr:DNA primase [Coriobacteriaceae bacterium]
MISDEDKNKVRDATDLVALVQETVELKPRGNTDLWGCCPFHGEKTPSFHVIPATQVWHCFGCGEGGDAFTYVMKREGLSFPESIRYLADRAGIELEDDPAFKRKGTKRNRLIEVCEATAEFYHTLLMRGKDARGREYCKGRELDAATCKKYRLGFAPGRGALVRHLGELGFKPQEMIDANVALRNRNGGLSDRFFDRVMFPIMDEQGRCIAFGGRALDKEKTHAKYLNSSETPIFHKGKNLYGFNWAKDHIVAQNEVIVVEGYISAMSCWKAGIENIVAVLGTALTEAHVKTLTRFTKKIIYMFDGDAAGQKAARRAIQFIEKDDIDLRCVILPDGQDPDDFVRANGGAALRELLDGSIPLMDFVFGKLEEESDISTPGGRAKAMKSALELIYPLRTSYMIDGYYMQIADRLGLDVEMIRSNAGKVFREVQQREETNLRREQQRERARAEREHAAGASGSGLPGASWPAGERVPSAAASVSTVPVPASASARPGEFAEEEVPYDYVPVFDEGEAPASALDATASVQDEAFGLSVLTDLERRQLACERELLTLLTTFPDTFRAYADRITEVEWVDGRHETIAWAALATPEGTSAADVMAAARAVCPEAAQLVSAGMISATSAHPTETNIVFLLDTLELYTVRRRTKAATARLRSDGSLGAEERRALMVQASQDTVRVRELEQAVEGIADPFRQN